MRELIDRYGDLVWSVARQFTGNDADAAEAVCDVFSTLWQRAGKYDPARGSEPSFILLLARRCLVDRYRREHRRPAEAPIPTSLTPATPADLSAGAEQAGLVRQAIAELPEHERNMLRLSVAEGYSHAQIAAQTSTPLGTVKTILRRSIRHIHDRLTVVLPTEAGRD